MGEDPRQLRDALEVVTTRLGLNRAVETGALWARWTEVVGPTIAARAQPSSLRRGVLRVRADSPVWATEIGYLSAEIQDRINGLLGPGLVTEVRIWTGPPPSKNVSTPATRRPIEVTRRAADHGSERDPVTALKRAKAAWARRTRTSRERRSGQG